MTVARSFFFWTREPGCWLNKILHVAHESTSFSLTRQSIPGHFLTASSESSSRRPFDAANGPLESLERQRNVPFSWMPWRAERREA
jgi:hypothetical protein